MNSKKRTETMDVHKFTSDTALYDALCRSTDDYIYLCDIQKNLFYFPESMVTEFNLPACVIEDATPIWGACIHETEQASFYAAFQEIVDGNTSIHCQEYRALNKDGNWVWLRCRGYLEHDESGTPTLFAGIITNLGKKSKIDPVSSLPNKFEFENRIRSQLTESQSGCLLLLGLDNFKHINNLYGKDFGDLVIRAAAKRIQELIPAKWEVYRMDGDIFGVYFSNEEPDTIEAIFFEIQKVFRKQQTLENNNYTCTISGGAACFIDKTIDFSTLCKQAEYALEYAKTDGKNRLSFHSEETMRGRERSLTLIELLRQSTEHNFADFELYFQPQVDADTCKVVSAEALLRWKCEKYANVSPVEFIPLLEQTGMIQPVGYWVLANAASACKAWREIYADFTVSVNLSYLQLLDKNFITNLMELLESYELTPSALHLELTESRIADENHTLKSTFDQLRSLGFCIEMDDFGTGYSSLEILKYSPADVVKIDRAFVKDIVNSDFDATFIRFAVSLCHSVGILVCLEGVETWQEYHLVKVMGLDLIQGYLFGKPVSRTEFETIVMEASC